MVDIYIGTSSNNMVEILLTWPQIIKAQKQDNWGDIFYFYNL